MSSSREGSFSRDKGMEVYEAKLLLSTFFRAMPKQIAKMTERDAEFRKRYSIDRWASIRKKGRQSALS